MSYIGNLIIFLFFFKNINTLKQYSLKTVGSIPYSGDFFSVRPLLQEYLPYRSVRTYIDIII